MKRHWRLTSKGQPPARISPVRNPHGQIFPAGNPKMINGNILVDYPVVHFLAPYEINEINENHYGTIPWLDRDPLRLFSEAPDTAHSLGTWQGLWSHKCKKKCYDLNEGIQNQRNVMWAVVENHCLRQAPKQVIVSFCWGLLSLGFARHGLVRVLTKILVEEQICVRKRRGRTGRGKEKDGKGT